jgi:hypothetical protein
VLAAVAIDAALAALRRRRTESVDRTAGTPADAITVGTPAPVDST